MPAAPSLHLISFLARSHSSSQPHVLVNANTQEFYASTLGVSDKSFALKLLSGVTSGGIGAAISCPCDLVKGEFPLKTISQQSSPAPNC